MKNKEMFHVKRQYLFSSSAKNDSDLCTQACPYRLALLGTFSQRQSVSLCFRVAMLLKTQFACLRSRGQQTTKEKMHGFI